MQPAAVPVNQLPPPVIIESLLVDGLPQELPPAGRTDGRLSIPPGRHYFEFRFTGLSFTSPDKALSLAAGWLGEKLGGRWNRPPGEL
ncbi:MAG: hypothetical protein WDN00_13535 [Limisphaerales bacterium]